jgi:hypothetical protein
MPIERYQEQSNPKMRAFANTTKRPQKWLIEVPPSPFLTLVCIEIGQDLAHLHVRDSKMTEANSKE